VLTEGEEAVAWLNDTGYGHLASKIEGLKFHMLVPSRCGLLL